MPECAKVVAAAIRSSARPPVARLFLRAMPYYPEALEWDWDEEQGPPEIVEPCPSVSHARPYLDRGQKFEGRGDFVAITDTATRRAITTPMAALHALSLAYKTTKRE